MEVGRDELVEILDVHELGVDLLQHLLVEGLLQDVLVLLAQSHSSGVHRTQRDAVCQLYQSSVLSVGLEYLQVVPLQKYYVRQVELQSPSPAQTKTVQDLLQPIGRLPTVRSKQIAVGRLSPLLRTLLAQIAPAIEVSSEVSVPIDGLLEVSDDEGVHFGSGSRCREVEAWLFAKAAFHGIKLCKHER